MRRVLRNACAGEEEDMLGFRDDHDYDRALGVFQTADYTEVAISKAIGREEILRMPASDVPHVLRRTRESSRLNTLIRLYFLGLPVPVEAARSALAPVPLESWVEGELLCPPGSEDQVAPRVQIWPVSGLTLAVDLPWRRSTAPPPDFVVPPGPVTLELANAMVRRPCKRMLDLGTGSGMLALLAAPYAKSIMATDKNERAIEFTRFNARLNQIENVCCLIGNLFEPVAQQQFQLVLCNPPFVISPTQRYLFRDSGERGDVFCRRLVRSAIDYLETGGFFQFTANLAHQVGRSWKSDLEEWFEGLGCDVLALVDRTDDVSDYAMTWILSTESKDATLVSQLYEIWMDYFERERIEAVSYLLITLRRSVGRPTWIQIDDPPYRIAGPCGDELVRFFESRDLFAANHVEGLLNSRLRLAPEIRIEQEYTMTPGGLDVCNIRVKKTGGLQYPLSIHRNVTRLLAGCNGNQTLRQLLAEMADYLGVDWDRTVAVVLPAVRSLIERGVLFIVDPSKAH
jgi:methylase of polypeptide subunit release factors